MMDGTKFFLPLGWHLSSATRRNIDNHKSEWTSLSRCMLRQELMGEKFASTTEHVQRCGGGTGRQP
jgi:hypothetical protein